MQKNNLNNLPETIVLSSEIISKYTQDGRKQIGSLSIEVKICRGFKFIQITQEKYALKGQSPKNSCVTLDLMNPKIKDSLLKALEK